MIALKTSVSHGNKNDTGTQKHVKITLEHYLAVIKCTCSYGWIHERSYNKGIAELDGLKVTIFKGH